MRRFPLRVSVVVGMIAAHTVRIPSHGMHCDQLHVVITELPTRVVMQEPALAADIGAASPAAMANASINLRISHSPPFVFVIAFIASSHAPILLGRTPAKPADIGRAKLVLDHVLCRRGSPSLAAACAAIKSDGR